MKITVNKSKEGKHKEIPASRVLVVIGNDHAGHATKQTIIKLLAKNNYTILDVGGFSPDVSDDYPDYAAEVAKTVASDKTGMTKGILICGSGTGMVIAANKVRGIRAAFSFDKHSAIMARHDNDANVLCLRGLNFPANTSAQLALLFLKTSFSGIDRHKRRVKKVMALEARR